jgi:signal transduction histidine kinase
LHGASTTPATCSAPSGSHRCIIPAQACLAEAHPCIDRLARSFELLARSRGILFEATIPLGTIYARVDADRFEKVSANLLSNAIRFSSAGGHVRFTVEPRPDPGELVVTVEDDGPGIPLDQQALIFERFHQVHDSSKRTHVRLSRRMCSRVLRWKSLSE